MSVTVRKLKVLKVLDEAKLKKWAIALCVKYALVILPSVIFLLAVVPKLNFPENYALGSIFLIMIVGYSFGLLPYEENFLRTFNFGKKRNAKLTKILELPSASYFAQRIRFEYIVDQITLECVINKFSFGRKEYDKLRVGDEITILIDPENSRKSIIKSKKLMSKYCLRTDEKEL